MDAGNVPAATDVDDGTDSYGPELINELCEDCGARLLRSYTGAKWCSKNWDSDKHRCKLAGHVKIDC